MACIVLFLFSFNKLYSAMRFEYFRMLLTNNHVLEGGSIAVEITPLPLINVGFSTKQNADFSSNIEYGGGGAQEHGISQIVQPIVRIIELGVK